VLWVQIGSFFIRLKIYSNIYKTHILTPFFEHLSDCERICTFYQWDIVAAHTVNHSLHCLLSVFLDRIISRWPWLSVHYRWICAIFFYLWDMLKVKCMVITLALHTVWKASIENAVFSVSPAEFWHMKSIFFHMRCVSGSCRKPFSTLSVHLVSTDSSGNCSALN